MTEINDYVCPTCGGRVSVQVVVPYMRDSDMPLEEAYSVEAWLCQGCNREFGRWDDYGFGYFADGAWRRDRNQPPALKLTMWSDGGRHASSSAVPSQAHEPVRRLSVFLSHSSVDKPFVRRLAARLDAARVRVWLDEAELAVGDSLIERIGQAVSDTDFVIAVISSASVRSPWVQKELALAATKEVERQKISILPVVIDDCELPAFLRDKVYADFCSHERFDVGMTQLLKAMGLS